MPAVLFKGSSMTIISIADADMSARISTSGGIILDLWWKRTDRSIPLLRPAVNDAVSATGSACFPLVPFGNRIAGNTFRFEDVEHVLKPNVPWDPHYLHGDGWQSVWSVDQQTEKDVTLVLEHLDPALSPYCYSATQTFSIEKSGFVMALSVTNRGRQPLPFGIGWHPYFPMTPQTTLVAPARRYWTEVDGWLPGVSTDFPRDADFRLPRALPHRWLNNGLEDWCGMAEVTWPEMAAGLTIEADPVFRHAFVFVSDMAFDPSFRRDYFCLEPMSHLANGHNLPGLGGLQILEPGETLGGRMKLVPGPIPIPNQNSIPYDAL